MDGHCELALCEHRRLQCSNRTRMPYIGASRVGHFQDCRNCLLNAIAMVGYGFPNTHNGILLMDVPIAPCEISDWGHLEAGCQVSH